MHLVSQSPQDTGAIAARLATTWKDALRGRSSALVVALEGELGAGKTTLVQGIAHALGIREMPKSPTFNLVKEYPVPGTDLHVWHVDCYRLSGRADLAALDLHHVFADPHNLVLVEWAQRVADALPDDHIVVCMEHAGADKRSISVNEHPKR
ncbi:MAG TPA: tRNA (adenosine(37)-N6)-threonylcarbamoyltransferase complex ATPase subunit type 1 TsaE [Candidatus Paceibacterota bacterium]|nr:tRNA (adenosine(37)-N6)-threonylcarbamoyltransferase complex ATPase subunit type 1 TsaE [Candidatus Paceibacterota bacterium]